MKFIGCENVKQSNIISNKKIIFKYLSLDACNKLGFKPCPLFDQHKIYKIICTKSLLIPPPPPPNSRVNKAYCNIAFMQLADQIGLIKKKSKNVNAKRCLHPIQSYKKNFFFCSNF